MDEIRRGVEIVGECWEWVHSRTSRQRYPMMQIDGVPTRVHRVVCELAHGPIPAGHVVRHTCDNRWCVRPEHLLTGTRQDNMGDAVERGRHARGQMLPQTKLTAEQAAEIFTFTSPHSEYVIWTILAERYGVGRGAIRGVREGRTWKHLWKNH